MNEICNRISLDFSNIYPLLVAVLGEPEELHQTSPLAHCDSALDVLIATVLTQATTDRNALKAWNNFKAHYQSFGQVMEEGAGQLEALIRPAGMATQRSRVIIDILQAVFAHFGRYTLEDLAGDPDRAWEFLSGLPGVGPKTAACTMLFGLKHPFFPVDVHIERIVKRQGWFPPKTTPVIIQERLATLVPMELMEGLHILLLNMGRVYCRPSHPDCDRCPLEQSCSKRM